MSKSRQVNGTADGSNYIDSIGRLFTLQLKCNMVYVCRNMLVWSQDITRTTWLHFVNIRCCV